MFELFCHYSCTIIDKTIKKNDDSSNPFDGMHTPEENEGFIAVENAAKFCCRGIKTDCQCDQIRFNRLVFKKKSINDDYPIRGIYLNKWPYEDCHGPRAKDQLSKVIEELRQQEQSIK